MSEALELRAGIAGRFPLSGFPGVTNHVFVDNIVEYAERMAKPKTVKKDPFSTEDLII